MLLLSLLSRILISQHWKTLNSLAPFLRSIFKSNGSPRTSEKIALQNALYKRAQTGDGFADNQVLHLKCAFVGVERFGIGEEAGHVVVCDYAVSAQQLPGPGHRLAAL